MTGDVDALDTVFLFVLAPLATALLAGAIMTAVLGYWIPAAALVFALALLVACVLAPWGLQRAARTRRRRGKRGRPARRCAGRGGRPRRHGGAACAGADPRAFRAPVRAERAGAPGPASRRAGSGSCRPRGRAGCVVVRAGRTRGRRPVRAFAGGSAAGGHGHIRSGRAHHARRVAPGLGGVRGARIREVAQCEPDMRDPDAPAALPADGALELDGLRFAYPDGALVLDGVSLRVAPGERVAIQGERRGQVHAAASDPAAGRSAGWSGALWRTRRARLRAGRLAPAHRAAVAGRAGVPGHAAHQSADRRPFGGRSRAVARAGRRAPGRFRARLPDGLDAWAGETGSLLSAGQARRLCLARALLSPARVLVLDEPTAGLDAAAEADFLRDLGRAAQGAPWCWPRMRRRARWTGAACCAGTVA